MTVVLSVAQARALADLLPQIDDRVVTMYEDGDILVVDPKVVRAGMDVDLRTFFITQSGLVLDKKAEPKKIVKEDKEQSEPPAEPPKEGPAEPPKEPPADTSPPGDEDPPDVGEPILG